MAKLSVFYEKATKLPNGTLQNQVLEISAIAHSRQQAENLSYDDFEINLFINGQFIADISHVLGKTPVFTELIDSTDWEQVYYQTVIEEKEVAHA